MLPRPPWVFLSQRGALHFPGSQFPTYLQELGFPVPLNYFLTSEFSALLVFFFVCLFLNTGISLLGNELKKKSLKISCFLFSPMEVEAIAR